MPNEPLYKVVFLNQGEVYEVYVRSVGQGGIFGFVELSEFVFDTATTVLLDPSEEKLKSEFEGVTRCHIPMHSVIRIDEVKKQGHAKIRAASDGSDKVTPFPIYTRGGPESS